MDQDRSLPTEMKIYSECVTESEERGRGGTCIGESESGMDGWMEGRREGDCSEREK
jgi:hypothetical protein